jgi:hypothetical protein
VIAQARQVCGARVNAERGRDVVHFLRREDVCGLDFPGVQDLAPQRHDRLERAVARLLGGPAGRVALDQEQLAALRLLQRAVGELARQRRPARDALAGDARGGLGALLRIADRELRDFFAGLRMLVEPERESILHHAGDERRGLARRKLFLGLARELRIRHAHESTKATPIQTSSGRA